MKANTVGMDIAAIVEYRGRVSMAAALFLIGGFTRPEKMISK
tara:strand:- start:233 stop:358 length:126 start_codon:yes stop_codon:yes gene_type:complete